jgi:hypothetical protein
LTISILDAAVWLSSLPRSRVTDLSMYADALQASDQLSKADLLLRVRIAMSYYANELETTLGDVSWTSNPAPFWTKGLYTSNGPKQNDTHDDCLQS